MFRTPLNDFAGVVLIDPDTGVPYTAGGPSVDREVVVTTYRVITAFTGAAVGATVTCTQVIDVTGTPTTIATVWRNQTTASDLASAPSSVNIELVGSTGLTNTQLRASAVPVSGTVGVSGSVAVTGPATDTQLRATPLRAVLSSAIKVVDASNVLVDSFGGTSPIAIASGNVSVIQLTINSRSGTDGKLYVNVRESMDGNNYRTIYTFPVSLATGSIQDVISAPIVFFGTHLEYSFTCLTSDASTFNITVTRNQLNNTAIRPTRQSYDYDDINLNSLDSVNDPSLQVYADGCNTAQLVVNLGAAPTPPSLQLEGSDDNGATFYSLGSPLVTVANKTVSVTVPNISCGRIRARVSSAGTGAEKGYVLLRAF